MKIYYLIDQLKNNAICLKFLLHLKCRGWSKMNTSEQTISAKRLAFFLKSYLCGFANFDFSVVFTFCPNNWSKSTSSKSYQFARRFSQKFFTSLYHYAFQRASEVLRIYNYTTSTNSTPRKHVSSELWHSCA